MRAYDYQKPLRSLWEWDVSQYKEGNRDPESYEFLNLSERRFLHELGLKPNDLYDFAEDYVRSGEPDFTTFALIVDVRRRYFGEVQEGVPSGETVSPDALPTRDAELAGIPWLPRLLEKARGRLRGELHPDVSFPCPLDRQFLKEHDIHPVEVLSKIWETETEPARLVDWFFKRSKAPAPVSVCPPRQHPRATNNGNSYQVPGLPASR